MKIFIMVCIMNLILFTTSVVAKDRFDEIDTNHDGFISWDEFHAAMPNLTKAAFDSINLSKDGKISREEWEKFQNSHSGMMNMGEGSGSMGGEMKMDPDKMGSNHPTMKNGKPLITPPSN